MSVKSVPASRELPAEGNKPAEMSSDVTVKPPPPSNWRLVWSKVAEKMAERKVSCPGNSQIDGAEKSRPDIPQLYGLATPPDHRTKVLVLERQGGENRTMLAANHCLW